MHSLERHLLVSICLIAQLALVGCGDDPVTTPDGQPIVFTGQLRQGGRVERPLILAEEGTVRITATDLTPVLIEAPDGEVPELFIGVGIGTPENGECNITFGETLAEGDSLELLLDDPVKCLLLFDNGALPPDAIIAYTVTIEDLKSD